MGRRSKTSAALKRARNRYDRVVVINPNFKVGDDLDLVIFKNNIDTVEGNLKQYNEYLRLADALLNDITAGEKALRAMNARILAGVGAQYGKDSNEYENAGGVRTSETKRS